MPKMKIKLLFCSLLIFPTFVFSQGKYDKLITDGKYSTAQKKIDKKLTKDPFALDYAYSKVVLYNTKAYENYDTETAYTTVIDLKDKFEDLPQGDKGKYEKDGISIASIIALSKQVISNAFNDVLSSSEIKDYEHFLSFYSSAEDGLKEQITNKIYSLAFQLAKDQNTVLAFEEFMKKYPMAPQKKTAISMRNQAAFEDAKKENTSQAFKVFIYTYPDANQVDQAWQYIYKMDFDLLLGSTNYRDYQKYMSDYPKSPYNSVAAEKYDLFLYQEKTSQGQLNDYISFIKNYKKNRYRNDAIQKAFEVGSQSDDFLVLRYVAEELGQYGSIASVVQSMYQIISKDGRSNYLEKFYDEYGEYIDDLQYENDIALAYRFDNLNLKNITFENYSEIDAFIRDAAPKKIALTALTQIARSAIDGENWTEAAKVYRKYKTSFTGLKEYEKTLLLLEEKVIDDFKKIPISEKLNTSSGNEYVPMMTADGSKLYFCGRDRYDNLGGEDIYVSEHNGFDWTNPELINELSSSSKNEAPESVTVDGTKMTIFISGKLYETTKTIYGWSEPELMGNNINEGNWNADVCYTGDGKAVLFTSMRDGGYNYINTPDGSGYHPADIYVSLKDENGDWMEPINLGPTINTMYSERTPFLHPDMKTMYFSSNGHGGLGSLDVYMTTRLKEDSWTEWSEPVNLGKYFNTSGNNWGYKITTDGKMAYFSEEKSSKDKNQDLLWLKLPPRLRPELVATVKGSLKDRNDKPVGARLLIEDLTSGNTIAEANSDPTNGEFFVVLPLGKIYGYHVDKKELFPVSGNIDLREANEAIEKLDNIKILTFDEMIQEGLAVPVNNLFFDFGESKLLATSEPELKRIAKILIQKNLKISIEGHTDNVGSDEFNYELSLKRCNAVKRFLISEGCRPDQLETTGYGRTKPVATNDTDEGRALNRRVELRFIK